eukprot:6185169-Pleurochrysis_carterae.AAC.1
MRDVQRDDDQLIITQPTSVARIASSAQTWMRQKIHTMHASTCRQRSSSSSDADGMPRLCTDSELHITADLKLSVVVLLR